MKRDTMYDMESTSQTHIRSQITSTKWNSMRRHNNECVNNLICTKHHIIMMIYFHCTCILSFHYKLSLMLQFLLVTRTKNESKQCNYCVRPKCHAPQIYEFSAVFTSCTSQRFANANTSDKE